MVADHAEPWNPDRRWADPLIALLALAIGILLAWRLLSGTLDGPAVPARVGAQARLAELRQAAQDLARPALGSSLLAGSPATFADGDTAAWDRALLAVLAGEAGDRHTAAELVPKEPFPGREAFQRCYRWAYLSEGTPPTAEDRARVRTALRDGYAARLLEARLLQQGDPAGARRLRDEARAWALPRLGGLALAGLAFVLAVPAGILVGTYLAVAGKRVRPWPVPRSALSGRALALVLLGWFAVFLSSGTLAGSLLAGAPFLRPFALPLVYGLHAGAGLVLLCRLEGMSPPALARRLMPGAHARSLAWGLGFLAIAVVLDLAVSLALGPFLRSQPNPQRALMDVVAGTQGLLPLGMLLLTVSVAAPIFEETLFRGILLPWLGHRLEARLGPGPGWCAALAVSGGGFGLIHLQPAALPVLATLGVVLGLAFLHTRNLLTSILVHGLWNGSVFLFYRIVLG